MALFDYAVILHKPPIAAGGEVAIDYFVMRLILISLSLDYKRLNHQKRYLR